MSPRAYVTARPLPFGQSVPQADGIAWMQEALRRSARTRGLSDDRAVELALRFYDRLARAANIGSRTTCLADYTHQDWDRMTLFAEPPSGDGQMPADVTADGAPWYRASLDARMEIFADTALHLARSAFDDDTEAPDLLAQVSCTGYDSPTAAQQLAIEKGWTVGTRLLHIGHMGCYAALPATALAVDVISAQQPALAYEDMPGDDAPDVHAALFLVELCTLHHDPSTTDIEQVVQQCLFADGAARLDLTTDQPAGRSLAFLGYDEVLLPETGGAMTWRVADNRFRMTLSRDVPRHIETNLAPAMSRFLANHGFAVEDVAVWAVHPGGPRVIESAAEALDLPDAAVGHSQDVLYRHGNMSSTTVPHIWSSILGDADVAPGTLVASVAFGPGLTVAMTLMRVEGQIER